jgi:diguanylate cyclase (GGDEF)-like protein/PAS domain S-box-containing protein
MSAAPEKILVVDDDPTARILFRAALQIFGYQVSLAVDGADALRHFRAEPFDMVMLDIDMPDMNGHEVCTILRAEAGPLLPILMVTGMDDVQSVERAYSSGATDFIAKPMNWALIGHRVKYLFRGHQTLLNLRAAEARNAAILAAIPDLLFELDMEGRYINFHSPRVELLAAPAETIIGKTLAEILPPAAALVCMAALQAAHDNGSSSGKQYELRLPQGVFWFELSVSRKGADPGQPPRFIVLSRDITERKEAEQKILRLAYFDSLTGLPNRQSFLERVDREIRRARISNDKLGILFLDLDGFKNVNDTLGHCAGDLALQLTADRLREAVRSVDLVSRTSEPVADVEIARLGGDEFTALIQNIKHPQDAHAIAGRILQLMRDPFMLNGLEVMLTASIGIALYPQDGDDAATLLKHADTALYHAKDSGRDNCQYYSASLTRIAMQRMQLESDLRLALERDEFSLVYQPQIDVVSGRIHSVEALIRWNRPAHGLFPPLEFIPAAEQCGLIVPIGQWVLRTACADASRWQHEGHPLRIAVNLSPVQFKEPHLVQMVLDVLAQTGLAPELLEFEVTESTVMEDTAATMATLNAFRACGVHIALDDFGTGYSSLSYLKRMPLGNLKVDRSFVMGLPGDYESYAIVRAILAMAESLGLSVTAEGVETAEQALVLKDMACSSLQGYYFSHPVMASELPALLAQYGAQNVLLPVDMPRPGAILQ